MPIDFLLVDDDPVNNLICDLIIKQVLPDAAVHAFTEPLAAFAYLNHPETRNTGNITVLFLDINMPLMSGWDFLQAFDKLENDVKARFRIHMLSSSVDPRDRERAGADQNVFRYLEKPLTMGAIQDALQRFEKLPLLAKAG